MNSFFITAPLGIAILFFASFTHADYTVRIVDTEYYAKVAKPSSGIQITVKNSHIDASLGELAAEFSTVFPSLNSHYSTAKNFAKDACKSVYLDYSGHTISFDGPLNLRLAGVQNEVTVKLTELDSYFKVRCDKGAYFDASVTAKSNNTTLSGKYSLQTGLVDNITLVDNFTIDADTSFGDFFTNILLDVFGLSTLPIELADFTEGLVFNTGGGLYKYIKPNTYIVGGVDVGKKITDTIINEISGQSLDITLQEYPTVPATKAILCHEPGNVPFDEEIMKITLSDDISIDVHRKVTQNCKWNKGIPDY